MKSIKSIAIILLSLFCLVYGVLMAILAIIFNELTPFIGGVMFMLIGYIPLYVYWGKLDSIARDIL